MSARLDLPAWPTLNLERKLGGRICGVDEAGYAPLAGPVVAAAVVLPLGPKPRALRGLTDSKLLPAAARERYFDILHEIADIGVGIASVEEIDRLNIYQADLLAMRRAIEALGAIPDHALVDGRGAPPVGCSVTTLIKGDRRSLSIAAASVVAKTVRDRHMQSLAQDWPGYGWHRNVGYGTDEHYLGLLRRGPTEHHRRTFAPLTTLFEPGSPKTARFRFEMVDAVAAPHRIELLELRRDLHAVFDGDGRHLGQIKNVRGRWAFQATGYATGGEPIIGAGPCASCHGLDLRAPSRDELVQLFRFGPAPRSGLA